MMAVAENTVSNGKSAQDTAGGSKAAQPSGRVPLIVFGVALLAATGAVQAQIVADSQAQAAQRPTVLKNSDGSPLVNIQTPNNKGLSHNRYTQFDVDAKGAVLNNNRASNPNLSKGSAQLILNEIRSNSPSQLNGIISVGGAKADVVIANPAGIQVNGGGFQNASRAVLTTGAPVLKDGGLDSFDIRKGSVSIGSGGFDNRGADYTEILARAASVQGKIQANQLSVSTGAQKVDFQSGEVSNGTAEGTKPLTAIDTAALGGMYANSITLLANEKGIGVKNAGTLEAKQQLVITSSGRIENQGTIRTTAQSSDTEPTYLGIQANGSGAAGAVISDGGKIESKGLMVIESAEDIGLRNQAIVQNISTTPSGLILDAGRNLVIEKNTAMFNTQGAVGFTAGNRTLINQASVYGSTLYSHSQSDVALQSGSKLNVKDNVTILSNKNIGIDGQITSREGSLHIEASGPVNPTDTQATATVTAKKASLSAAKNLNILAQTDIHTQTSAIKAAENLNLQAGNNLNLNVNQPLPDGVKNIGLKAGEQAAVTSGGQSLAAAQDLSIEAGKIALDNTHLKAGSGNLSLSALKGGINLNAAANQQLKLEAGRNLEAAALVGNLSSNGLDARANKGYVSMLAQGDAHFTGASNLSGQTGVYLGSVGQGRLKVDNTNIQAAAGNVQLLAGADLEYSNGAQRNTISGNQININSNSGHTHLQTTKLDAKNGNLSVSAGGELGLLNVDSSSRYNTIFAAGKSSAVLNQLNAVAGRHMSISSKGNEILQNYEQTSKNKLQAAGVLSLQSAQWNFANNSQMLGGAVNLVSQKSSVNLSPTTNVRAVSNAVLRDDAELKSIDGNLNIEAAQQVYLQRGKNMSADRDLSIKSGGKFTLVGIGGSAGNPSAQTSTLSAKDNIRIVAGEVDIQGATIKAGKDLSLISRETMKIYPVESTLKQMIPEHKVQELQRDSREIDARIAALKQANPNDKRIASLEQEKDNIDFYIQSFNKTVKGHYPKGYEYQQSSLSGRNVNLLAGQGIEISAADITASGKINIESAGMLPQKEGRPAAAILIANTNDSYEIGLQRFKSHYDKASLNKPSRLIGKQGISIRAPFANDNANVVISASKLSAPGGSIAVDAYGDVVFGYGENNAYTFLKTKSKSGGIIRKTKFNYARNHLIMPAPVDLDAGQSIDVTAGGDIDAYSTHFYAPKGQTKLTAGEELNLLAVEGQHYQQLQTVTTSRFVGIKIKNKDYTRSELAEASLPVKVIAQGVNTRSGWDTVLEGTEFHTSLGGAVIQAGVGDKARADAKIILKGITDKVTTESQSQSNAVVWQRISGQGSTVETLKLPKFDGPSAPTLSAPGGYIADIPKGDLKTEISKLAANPEYAYLKQLQMNKNVDWKQVELAYKQWDYEQEGLTGAGAALITIIVTALTYGAATPAVAGATATGTTAGATTVATTTAVGTGTTVVGAGALTSTQLAGVAGLAALNSKAAVSLINNKGDIGKTLKELGRSDTVKEVLTATVTAGIADKLGASSLFTHANQEWVNKLTLNLATATSTAAATTAINGGSLQDNLEKSILNALVQTAHMEVSGEIKDLNLDYVAHKIAHAVAGCAAAAANNSRCQDGAIGATVGEIVAEGMGRGKKGSSLSKVEQQKIIGYAKVVAGSVAALNNGDVNTAANAAQVAVVNNFLKSDTGKTGFLTKEEIELLDRVAKEANAPSIEYFINEQRKIENSTLSPQEKAKKLADLEKSHRAASDRMVAVIAKFPKGSKERGMMYDIASSNKMPSILLSIPPYDDQSYFIRTERGDWLPSRDPSQAPSGFSKVQRLWMIADVMSAEEANIIADMYLVGARGGSLSKSNTKTVIIKSPVKVSAKGTIGKDSFYDVNQRAKANPTLRPTLIADRVNAKIAKDGVARPNGTIADSHAEIGVIQQAYDAGKTKNASMVMRVEGKDVCSYCKGDIAAAAEIAGLKKLTITATEKGTTKIYSWQPGMKALKEMKND